MVVIDRIIMKSRHVITPEILKTQTLDKLHVSHMGIEKFREHESAYWFNINDDIENHIKIAQRALLFSRHNLRTR